MTIEEKLAMAVKALKWYAEGARPSREHPYIEFGCGCCSSSVTYDTEGDGHEMDYKEYDREVQGKLARNTLKALGEE